MSTLSESALRRLSLIKMLLERARQLAGAPNPVSSLAVLTLHDAAEWLLMLVADEKRVSVRKKPGFEDRFDDLKKADIRLAHEAAMHRMNRARNGLKHDGILLAHEQVAEALADTESFVSENAESLLDVSLDEVSLAWLIPFDEVRDSIVRAEGALAASKWKEATELAAVGSEKLSRRHERAVRPHGGSSASRDYDLDLLSNFASAMSASGQLGHGDVNPTFLSAAGDFAKAVRGELEDLRREIEALATGINYDERRRFVSITPWVTGPDDDLKIMWPAGQEPTREEAEFCVQFVIDAAMALHERLGDVL